MDICKSSRNLIVRVTRGASSGRGDPASAHLAVRSVLKETGPLNLFPAEPSWQTAPARGGRQGRGTSAGRGQHQQQQQQQCSQQSLQRPPAQRAYDQQSGSQAAVGRSSCGASSTASINAKWLDVLFFQVIRGSPRRGWRFSCRPLPFFLGRRLHQRRWMRLPAVNLLIRRATSTCPRGVA